MLIITATKKTQKTQLNFYANYVTLIHLVKIF
jgi:hypothetical protein